MPMKTQSILLAAGFAWLALSGPAAAQSVVPDKADRSDRSDSAGPTMKSPVDPGLSKTPGSGSSGSSMSGPSNSGVIVVPPKTGTEEMVTQPKNVDPGIAGSSREIDRKNLEKSEDKAGAASSGKAY
jgi:hypothetical protein